MVNREPVRLGDYESDPSEEERDEGSAGSQDSDSETELTQVSKKKEQPQPAGKSQADSSSEEGDESESDSESESDGTDARKSDIGVKKPLSKPKDPEPVTPSMSTVAKRSVNGKAPEVKGAKKEEKKSEPESEVKPRFQRIWSEEDEIVILEGMIEYSRKKKSDPVSDLSAFHGLIKKNLHVDVSKVQLQDKIRNLKRKYKNNKSKEKEGKYRAFSKAHDQKVYELSKSIWGKESSDVKGVGSSQDNGGSAVKKGAFEKEGAKGSKNVVAVAVSEKREKTSLGKRVSTGGMSVEDRLIASDEEIFETGRGVEGEREWKKLRVKEVELHLKLLELRTAQAKLLLDAIKFEEH